MVPKIFSFLAIALAGSAAYLGYDANQKVDALQTKGQAAYGNWQTTKSKLEATEKKLKETEDTLTETKATLETTRTELVAAKDDLSKKAKELTEAQDKLMTVEAELSGVKKKLEEVLGGGNIDDLKKQIGDMANKVKDQEAKIGTLEKEKAELTTAVETLSARNKDLDAQVAKQNSKVNRWEKNFMEKGISGTVRAVNSGWGFCVLSIGDRQGAAANKIMIVARDGQAIGKVRISNVEANQSVADIMTNTFAKGTFVQPGDTVIFTGEDKVKSEEPAADAAPAPAGIPALPVR